MNAKLLTVAAAAALMLGAGVAAAQAPRKDVIWARSTAGAPITLDGVLSEPAWALAESVTIYLRSDNGIPGSGYKLEAGILPKDSTRATLKFLTVGNAIYMAAIVPDSSVGGSKDFNRFDGFLMAIKDHGLAARPAPPAEYLYSWWYEDDLPPNDTAPGKIPTFVGAWGTHEPMGGPRTPEQIDAWDAVTVVDGLANSDATIDQRYVFEMKFNLTPMGYDVTDSDGDVVEWNGSIYDCDWLWPNIPKFSANRVWWQGPWGNAYHYHNVRIHSKPSVTINSGAVPVIPPDVRIPNAAFRDPPVIDGQLTEEVWQLAPSFDIRFGDDALRASYPGMGPWRSGQYQPPVNGGLAAVLDPGDATVKWFFKDDSLYLGFDVRDVVVQHHPSFDRWDGFLVSINDRAIKSLDNNLVGRRLSFQVGPGGTAVPQDYLAFMVDSLRAKLAIALKPGTTVDTVGADTDAGYTAELRLHLPALGYPPGRGDGTIFIGVNLLDGDSFVPFTDSYGTRTWWQREYEGQDGPAWGYLDPNFHVNSVEDDAITSGRLMMLGNHPNPFLRATTLRYVLPRDGEVSLEVFDVAGRRVESRALGLQRAGVRSASVGGVDWKPGLYLYRLRIVDPATGVEASATGRMMRLK